MKNCLKIIRYWGVVLLFSVAFSQEGMIPAFKLESSDLELHRLAKPGTPFDKVGRKFAILAEEGGTFEAWAYPLKLFRNFEFSFFVGNSTRPIKARDIVHHISVTPAATVLTYTYQSFTVRAIFITALEEAGALILLSVDTTVPLTIVCGFIPVLQPMWPAGLGGQYAYWNDNLKAYVISESTAKNQGLIGSPAARGISYTPAHMLSDLPNEFKIEIPEPRLVQQKFIPIVMAGGRGKQEEVVAIYQKLLADPQRFYSQAVAHFRDLREHTLQIETPHRGLNLAFEWAKVAFDNLVVENPDLGKGLVAGLGASGNSGRPGFGWFFGGDAYINTFSMNSYHAYATVKDALTFTQKWQRQDGKMAHELSQAAGYIDWWKDYHYGYIHGDTSPYYIAAMYDYVKMSRDIDFIRDSWPSLKKAYQWCLSTDANGDGLMDNRKAGLGATEYGDLTGVETDIYLAAVWARAAYSMQYLAEVVGDSSLAEHAGAVYRKARAAFNEKFWDENTHFYSFAFNWRGERVTEISPWCTVGLMWNLGTPERSLSSLQKINSSELTTDWGIRSISIQSKYYQPLNYNYGAVWPFLTSWVATAQFKHHLLLQGYHSLMSTVQHTFDHALGYITEVFSGTHNIWPQEAVSHQGFSSAGVVLPLVRGMLGLEGDALQRIIQFAPHFPANWQRVSIHHYQIGTARLDFSYQRNNGLIRMEVSGENCSGYRLTFAPALGIGSRINEVRVNGKRVNFQQKDYSYLTQPIVTVQLQEYSTIVEIDYRPTLEFVPPVVESRIGDRNKGLKFISITKNRKKFKLIVEGISGKNYDLKVMGVERIQRVDGAIREGRFLKIGMPDVAPGEFVTREITIEID